MADVVDGTEAGCDLDAWLLRHCADLDGSAGAVSTVLVTSRHLGQPRIVDDVGAALDAGLRPRSLMLLVPALDSLDDVRVLSHLAELRRLGVSVCVDGFGAGASATDQWARLPFDHVRLDARLLGTAASPLLLRLTVETAHAFGYRVLAPDVADDGQLGMLRDAGCDLGQGPVFERDRGMSLARPVGGLGRAVRSGSPAGPSPDPPKPTIG
jgi:EAL domain-containing protein (putative c-di-GMP-specific phosphodiesterase class I)